jgi:hypothetical protein
MLRSNKINSRKFFLNDDFFNVINTEEKAYWLGFLYADGYITQHGSQKDIGVSLHIKDKSHLEKLKCSLGATYDVKEYIQKTGYARGKKYCRLLMSSDNMYDTLITKGVVPRKSLILTFPDVNILTIELIPHFIRGYFDGDGSIGVGTYKSNSKYGKEYWNKAKFSFQGTREFLNDLSEILRCVIIPKWSNEQIRFKLRKRHKDNKNSHYIESRGLLATLSFCEYIYKDATVFLQRKYEVYQKLKGLTNSRLN